MSDKYTIEALLEHNPCPEARAFLRTCDSIKEAWKKCEEPDWMFWALARLRPLSKTESVTLAVRFARRVLHYFENRYPSDKRPREAIEAAESDAWSAASAAWSAAASAEKREQCNIIREVIKL